MELDPLTYLEKRAEHAPEPRDIKDRLESHLVAYVIAAAGPYGRPARTRAAIRPNAPGTRGRRAMCEVPGRHHG